MLRIGTPRNLTSDRGRNSQPSFTPDGRAIVFSAVRDSTGQGDVTGSTSNPAPKPG